MPPARVVVSDVTEGMIAPEAEFVGTVYYREVSDLASEVSGRVDTVHFEEGQRVEEGDILVTINADILRKNTPGYEGLLRTGPGQSREGGEGA